MLKDGKKPSQRSTSVPAPKNCSTSRDRNEAQPPLSNTKAQVSTSDVSNQLYMQCFCHENHVVAPFANRSKQSAKFPKMPHRFAGDAYDLHIHLLRFTWIDTKYVTGIPGGSGIKETRLVECLRVRGHGGQTTMPLGVATA